MSERGKKVNKNNPAVRQARGAKKRAAKQERVENIVEATQGLPARESAAPNLDFPETQLVGGSAGESTSIPTWTPPLETAEMSDEKKAEVRETLKADVGKSEKGKARRRQEKSQTKADEAIIAEANREKTPAEQETYDANAAGVSVGSLRAVRQGRASFVDQKPKEKKNLVPLDVPAAEADQPRNLANPTGAGNFIPLGEAARGNRAQPVSAATEENTVDRIKSGMGVSGLQEGTSTEIINHPIHGEMEVSADVARAHRLYDLDWNRDPARANRLAGVGRDDYASPYQHKGGHYERLGRLQAAGENPDDISTYARKMGKTMYDVVEGRHALLQDKIDSTRMVNYGMQHLHPEDTFTHPETGEAHPISEWSTKHNMPLTPEGHPDLSATKGTNTSIYKDQNGNLQTTVPTHLGWWKTPTDGKSGRENLGERPGNWSFRTSVPALDAAPSTPPVSAYDFTLQQTREAIPLGSKQSRAEISQAARAMAAIHAASAGVSTPGRISTSQITDPGTGLALPEPVEKTTGARPTYIKTGNPADPKVYTRSELGEGINHLVSKQLAASVGGGPESSTGEITRSGDVATTGDTAPTQGRSRSFVPAPIVSNKTDAASAFQPSEAVVSGTGEENKALSDKLTGQADELDSAKLTTAAMGTAPQEKALEAPSFHVDESGNPIPQAPKVGRSGQRRTFVSGRTTNAPRGARQASIISSFIPVHNPPVGAEGPVVSSGVSAKPARRHKRTGEVLEPERKAIPGLTGSSTPLGGRAQSVQLELPEIGQAVAGGQKRLLKRGNPAAGTSNVYGIDPNTSTMANDSYRKQAEAELAEGREKESAPTMTASAASKFSRINLEDNPKQAPAQPMLDFGQPEREEEQKQLAAGKITHRSGEQWGFLDKRWLGNVGTENTSEELEQDLAADRRSKSSEKPRNPVAAPAGLPKAGPKSAPVDTTGAVPAAQRILGEMHGSKQIQDALTKLRGAQSTEE